MTSTFKDDLTALLDDVYDEMIDIRHDLHAHPELSSHEHRTSRVIRERLAHLGWDVAACPTETGAVATLRGAQPGHRVMIRADIDGLPVTEDSHLPHVSVNEGVMHACGHDVHTASLLGIADILSRGRDQLEGEYTLLFQPAEEELEGAKAMIAMGVLESHPVDFVIGAHVASLLPLGFVAVGPGIKWSQANAFTVRVEGKGGHGAVPTVAGSVVLAVSALAPRLGEIVEGLEFEGAACVCSAGVIRAGTKNNVVPRYGELRGTIRTFTPDQFPEAVARFKTILREVERDFAVECHLEFGEEAPALENDAGVTARATLSAREVVGADNVVELPPITFSDDMSEFLNRVPGCYLVIGGALADGTSGMHHSPEFVVDDEACRTFAGVLTNCAVDLAHS
jgi:amidohydrolase